MCLQEPEHKVLMFLLFFFLILKTWQYAGLPPPPWHSLLAAWPCFCHSRDPYYQLLLFNWFLRWVQFRESVSRADCASCCVWLATRGNQVTKEEHEQNKDREREPQILRVQGQGVSFFFASMCKILQQFLKSVSIEKFQEAEKRRLINMSMKSLIK